MFLTAVAIVAWGSGLWPALLTGLVATLALDFMFIPPLYGFDFDLTHLPRLAAFGVIAFLFAGTSARRRSAERSLTEAREELEIKVQARTAQLRKAHAEAVATEQRFRDLVNSIDGIVWEADARTLQFSFVSRQAERMLGYDVEQWVREPNFWKDHIHADDRETALKACLTAAEAMQPHDFEYRMIASDGRVVWLRDLLSVVVENGRPVALRGVIFDVTLRKKAEQELEELAGRLIHAQEEERSRIGRELHDHISQMLGVLTIRLDQLRVDEATPPPIAAALDGLRQNTAEITGDIHSLSHRLHSSTLDYLGVVPALQRLVNDFSSRSGIAVAFTHAGVTAPLPSDVALSLFRVAEESLTNIAKHSRARSGRVRLNGREEGISLIVEDDGIGFDPAHDEHRAGLGFVSMRERLRVIGGTVRVDSRPSHGTTIEAWVPAASLLPAEATATAVPEAPRTEGLRT